MAPTRWQSDAAPPAPQWPLPPLGMAIRRGMLGRCPACGLGSLFQGFLRVGCECRYWGVPLHLVCAEDAPTYFTVLLVAHIIVPLMLILELMERPPVWLMVGIFVPLAPAPAVGMLRPVKGATVGVILALNMLTPSVEEV